MTWTVFIYIEYKALYLECFVQRNDINCILDFLNFGVLRWLKGRLLQRRQSVVALLP